MFRILVLQALYSLSDEQAEFQLRDRLSFMRFVGLALHQAVPDAETIWLYREQLKQAGAIEGLFQQFDKALAAKGLLAMGGQIHRRHPDRRTAPKAVLLQTAGRPKWGRTTLDG